MFKFIELQPYNYLVVLWPLSRYSSTLISLSTYINRSEHYKTQTQNKLTREECNIQKRYHIILNQAMLIS